MGDKDNGNGRDPSSLIVPGQAIEYVMGGIRLSVNMHPVHVVTSPEFAKAGAWDGSPQALAVFMAATMEIAELRSQINHLTKIVERLTRVVPDWFDGVVARSGSGVEEEAQRVEPDPEEAERDYQERLRKVRSYLSKMGWKHDLIPKFAGIDRVPALDPDDTNRPTGVELRKIEAWLDSRGGSEWGAWHG